MPDVTFTPSTGQIRSSIGEIMGYLRQQIIDTTGLDGAAVYITRRKDPPRVVAEFAVGLWVRGENPDGQAIVGGGRVNDMRIRIVSVQIWSRNRLDEMDRDTAALTDYSLGQLNFEDSVFDAIELFAETNNQNQWIVTYPPRAGGISDPVPDAKNADFTVSTIELRVSYNRNLNQQQQ